MRGKANVYARPFPSSVKVLCIINMDSLCILEIRPGIKQGLSG